MIPPEGLHATGPRSDRMFRRQLTGVLPWCRETNAIRSRLSRWGEIPSEAHGPSRRAPSRPFAREERHGGTTMGVRTSLRGSTRTFIRTGWITTSAVTAALVAGPVAAQIGLEVN